ncbi:hypothetical protein FA10DRAFT_195563 [Acaromyces ingoldii]|uniref:Conserved oligomeric Golgi complex subunit 7 n=1 Tax=Acaromyces ingoldii TaxID=215250 RepID=A0A316YEQ3_9BASI|nr:hypothetical protein FA10DRAFT_195563 [Acaromyces ingoldii]PWN87128.1 hypothetical protein FA10DRAFT_195563 [Acaromyces ingoldii]
MSQQVSPLGARSSASKPSLLSPGSSLALRARDEDVAPSSSQSQSLSLIEGLDSCDDDGVGVGDWLNDTLAAGLSRNIGGGGGGQDRQQVPPSPALDLRLDGSPSSPHAVPKPAALPGSRDHLLAVDALLSSISSSLSLASQDTATSIDASIAGINGAIPRLSLELRLMKESASTLRDHISALQASSSLSSSSSVSLPSSSFSATAATGPASDSLDRLATLSSLRSRMAAALAVLSLAESWSTLSTDIDTYLSESKYAPAAARLAEARTSLAVFERTPEYEVRRSLLETLTCAFVDAISPLVVAAVRERAIGRVRELADVLAHVDGGRDVFRQRWRETRREGLVKDWASLQHLHHHEDRTAAALAASTTSLADVLPRFFAALVALVNEERLYAPVLFEDDPRGSVEAFVASTVLALEPGYGATLDSAARSDDDAALLVLVRAHASIKDAYSDIDRAIARVAPAEETPSKKQQQQQPPPASPVNLQRPSMTSPSSSSIQIKQAQQQQQQQQGSSPAADPRMSPTMGSSSISSSSVAQAPALTRRTSMNSSRRQSRRLSVANYPPSRQTSGTFDEQQQQQPAASSSSAAYTTHNELAAVLAASFAPATPGSWQRALLDPLLPFQLSYAALEKRLLAAEWARETSVRHRALAGDDEQQQQQQQQSHGSILLGAQLAKQLRDDVVAAAGLAEDAALRNVAFTYGLGTLGLVEAVDGLFAGLFDGAKARLEARAARAAQVARQQAADALGLGDGTALGGVGMGAGSGAGTGAGPGAGAGAGGDEWTAFEEGVGLLGTAYDAWRRLAEVERSVAARLVDAAEMVLGPSTWAGQEAMRRLCSTATSAPEAGGSGSGSGSAGLLHGGVPRAPLAILVAARCAQETAAADDEGLRAVMESVRAVARQEPGREEGPLYAPSSSRRTASAPAPAPVPAPGEAERGTMLNAARIALLAHVRTLQRHLTDMVLSPLMPHLEAYASLPAWEASRLPGAVNEYELSMPTFSLSPTEAMSRVGEGLLDLPRLLEVWADEAALRWAMAALPFVDDGDSGGEDEDEAQAEKQQKQAEGDAFEAVPRSPLHNHHRTESLSLAGPPSPTTERRAHSHRHSASVAAIATAPSSAAPLEADGSVSAATSSTAAAAATTAATNGAAATTAADDEGGAAGHVLQAYVQSLCLSLLAHLVHLVLPSIARLSAAGAAQLGADLDYLANILAALNVGEADSVTTSGGGGGGGGGGGSGGGRAQQQQQQQRQLSRALRAWRECAALSDADGKRLARGEAGTGAGSAEGAGAGAGAGAGPDREAGAQRESELARSEAFAMMRRLRDW